MSATNSSISSSTKESAHALLIARHIARVDPGNRCEFDILDVAASSTEEHPLVLEIQLSGTVNLIKCAGTLRVTDRAFGAHRDLSGGDSGKVTMTGFERSIYPGTSEHDRLEYFGVRVFSAYLDSNGEAPDPMEPAVPTTRRSAFWRDGAYVCD